MARRSGSFVDSVTRPRATALRVLVLDDNPIELALCVMLLSYAGHDVQGVADAAAFEAALAAREPDLVLLDIQLGNGPSGMELLLSLHRRGIKTPVALMSGYPDWYAPVVIAGTGYVGRLQKPVDAAAFAAQVEALAVRTT